MTSVAVYIATTAGPVRIERIVRDAMPQSMICLGRSSTILPITGAYDDFVRTGSGVIQREFGDESGGSYRMDVSGQIDDGVSWQLGAFLAHAVVATEGFDLAGIDDSPDQIVWATGRVNYDLVVEPVDHIAEKLKASAGQLAQWGVSGTNVTLVLCEDRNASEANTAGVPDQIELLSVGRTNNLLGGLGLPVKSGPLPVELSPAASVVPDNVAPGSNAKNAILLTLVLLTIFGVVGVYGWEAGWFNDRQQAIIASVAETKKSAAATLPATPPATLPILEVRLGIFERRAPDGSSCPAVHFGRVKAVELPILVAAPGELRDSQLSGLCGLSFVIDAGKSPLFADVRFKVTTGSFIEKSAKPVSFSGTQKFQNRASWSVDLPLSMQEPLDYRLTARISHKSLSDASVANIKTLGLSHRVFP